MEIQINKTSIETGMWHIQRYLMEKHGCDAAERMMGPLHWYIDTGRASLDFLRKLLAAKPFMIGRILAKGGSDMDVVKRIKGYLRYDAE